VSRTAPRPLSEAIGRLTGALAPASTLARVQEVWEDAVGPAIADAARPTAEREGVLTVACAAAGVPTRESLNRFSGLRPPSTCG